MGGNTEELLQKWGFWSRGGAGVGYHSSMQTLMRLVGAENCTPVAITDDLALGVDRVVGELKLRSPELFEVVYLRYVSQLGMALIAQRIRQSRHVAEKRLSGAVAWVDAALYLRGEQKKIG